MKVGFKTKAGDVALGASFVDFERTATEGDAWDVFAATTVAGLGMKAIYTGFDNNGAEKDTLRLIVSAKF